MTTEELKKELEELGLKIEPIGDSYLQIENAYGYCYAVIHAEIECSANINRVHFGDPEKQRKLFNAVTKYAATPIKERDPKRYFRYTLKSIADYSKQDVDFLNYRKSKGYWILGDYQQTDEWQTIFEENDPLLNDVNLEMFEAIEVDAEGNEIHD